jgi:LysR family cys regulon transcriptional activator
MNIQQLRYVRETVRQDLNLTEAAKALFTSQPGVSKQIRELELELGVDIFERRGKRFVAVTEPGQRIVAIAERVLQELDNLKRWGRIRPRGLGNCLATPHAGALRAAPGEPRSAPAIRRCICSSCRGTRRRSPRW